MRKIGVFSTELFIPFLVPAGAINIMILILYGVPYLA